MDLNTVTDGEYIGVCQNKILIAVVKVCVKNHEIADIEILGHKASYMEQAETIAGKVGVNLKIILKYILTNVKERKARTFVMLLSILLSAISNVFHGAELQGFADGHMKPEFVEQVKEMDGAEKVLPLYVFKNNVQGNSEPISRLEGTDNLEWYNSMFALRYTDSPMSEQAALSFASGERAVIINEDCMKRGGFSIGDTITLSNGTSGNSYVVAGSFKSRATDVEAVIPSAYAVLDFGASNYNFLAYTAADPDSIMVQIRDLFGSTQNWSRTVEEFNADALSTVGAFLKPMHSMTYFILLLAAVGIVNNLLINYMQKRRTIAMYKSVGLSNRQNIKMTLIESFTSGMIGAFVAVTVSYLEIQTIFLVAGSKISMLPELDFKVFLSAGAMGVLITLIGSVVPIIKSRKMKLVEEIKFE